MSSEHHEALVRVRIGMEQAHYAGNLVDGAHILQLFGDVATELLIRHDGDEGLFRAYDDVEFLEPVRAGDYLEVRGEITRVGRTSRAMSFEAHKVIRLAEDPDQPSRAEILDEPLLVCRATGTCVVPEHLQRSS
jgi:3-aminobutyryl-CoA ammonia-lyase